MDFLQEKVGEAEIEVQPGRQFEQFLLMLGVFQAQRGQYDGLIERTQSQFEHHFPGRLPAALEPGGGQAIFGVAFLELFEGCAQVLVCRGLAGVLCGNIDQ